MEASPGQVQKCDGCGFTATAPSHEPKAQAGIPPVPRRDLVAPLAVLSGVVGVGTFYLASFFAPFLFDAAALVLGIISRNDRAAAPLPAVAIALASAGFALSLATALWP